MIRVTINDPPTNRGLVTMGLLVLIFSVTGACIIAGGPADAPDHSLAEARLVQARRQLGEQTALRSELATRTARLEQQMVAADGWLRQLSSDLTVHVVDPLPECFDVMRKRKKVRR